MQAEPNLSIFQNSLKYELNLPLYYQIKSMINRGIANGSLKPGDLLPAEEQFCRQFDLSRTTIRQAFAALVKEGAVVRVKGKGTFISQNLKLDRNVDKLYNFTSEIEKLGMKASSVVIKFEKLIPPDDLQQIFKAAPDEMFNRIVRLRLASGQPLLLETTYIPTKYLKGLDSTILEKASLYRLLEQEGIDPYTATETYESVLITGEEKKLLKCKSNTTGFFLERIGRLRDGQIFELTQAIIRGDRSKIILNLHQDSCSINHQIE